MGCTPGQEPCHPNSKEAHEVTLTRGFWLGRTELTQAQYADLAGFNPSFNDNCETCPVENVSWYDAVSLANALSVAVGLPACYPCPDGVCEAPADPYDC
jgi:formylglycine-generating enzyme required for sulfatase activity